MLKQKGFSLIELSVTVVILGILMGIAVPSYRDYIHRSYLTEAFNAMAGLHLQMEQSYQDNSTYSAGGNCAVAIAATDHFNFNCAIGNGGQSYTVTASANGNNGLNGYTYTLNNVNQRTTSAYPHGTTPANCWMTKPGGC